MENENKNIPLKSPEANQTTQGPTLPVVEKSQQDASKKDSKIPSVTIYILISIILLVLGAYGFWFYQSAVGNKKVGSNEKPASTSTPEPLSSSSSFLKSETEENWKTFRDLRNWFQIDYPSNWQVALDGAEETTFIIYAPEAEKPTLPVPYKFGSLSISAAERNVESELDIEKWFDKRYSQKEDLPTTGGPVKKLVFETEKGMKVLECEPQIGEKNYFFLSRGSIISLSGNLTGEVEKDKKLKSLYGQMINTLAPYYP